MFWRLVVAAATGVLVEESLDNYLGESNVDAIVPFIALAVFLMWALLEIRRSMLQREAAVTHEARHGLDLDDWRETRP